MTKGKRMILEQGAERGQTRNPEQRRTRRCTKEEKAARLGRPCAFLNRTSVVFVAGALPGNQLADGRTGAGNGLFVGFHFRARGFFADGADAESYFLLFRIHLDDLEVVLEARLQMKRLAVFVGGFGLVAQAFNTLRDFDERAECGYSQDFAVNHIADVMRLEEGLPNVRLKLL